MSDGLDMDPYALAVHRYQLRRREWRTAAPEPASAPGARPNSIAIDSRSLVALRHSKYLLTCNSANMYRMYGVAMQSLYAQGQMRVR